MTWVILTLHAVEIAALAVLISRRRRPEMQILPMPVPQVPPPPETPRRARDAFQR